MSDQVKYTQKLKGDRVLVIGGTSGIGFGVAESLVEHGATVILSSSNASRVESTITKIQASYPSAKDRISGHVCNLGDEANLESNVAALFETVGKDGKLDHVVFTAGDPLAVATLDGITMDSIKKAGMVRFFAPLFIAKYAPKYLNAGPKSSITLTTGSVSERPMPNWSVVNSYATGLHGMTRGLALDLKPLRVNLVSPGAVDTELWKDFPEEEKMKMWKYLESKMPTGRVGRVEDIAEAYLYLIKDQNITGAVLSTNGGSLLVG